MSIHKKNPAQHFSVLLMPCEKEELQAVFQDMNIDYVRVGGATDEGPSHELIQYWWTEWHVRKKKVATLVTTHGSGLPYLNRVELQNGCLSSGHVHCSWSQWCICTTWARTCPTIQPQPVTGTLYGRARTKPDY